MIKTFVFSIALGVAFLISLRLPPSPSVLLQTAALISWGTWIVVIVFFLSRHAQRDLFTTRTAFPYHRLPIVGGISLFLLIETANLLPGGHPLIGFQLQQAFIIGFSFLFIFIGYILATMKDGLINPNSMFMGFAIIGLLASVVGLFQVFAPSVQVDPILPASPAVGRASGATGQTNHFASLLLWSLISVAGWLEFLRHRSTLSESAQDAHLMPDATLRPEQERNQSARVMDACITAVFATLVLGVVLSASRTGALGILLLALWGCVDRSLSRRTRRLLLSAPIQYAVGFTLMLFWSQWSGKTFAGAERLQQADQSTGRIQIWSETLALILQHPWTGVGWGNFNFAWTLTSFPNRSSELFNHAHNLPLHLAAELGLPLALVIVGCLLAGYGVAVKRVWRLPGAGGLLGRWAAAMLALIGMHSLLEYPLWYAHFLFPTSLLIGLLAGIATSQGIQGISTHHGSEPRPLGKTAQSQTDYFPFRFVIATLLLGGLASVGAGLFVNHDYFKVHLVYTNAIGDKPIDERIADGKTSVLFYPYAEKAAAFRAAESGAHDMRALHIAARNLLDPSLMILWARAYAHEGDVERARYIAARAREFRHPEVRKFFEACEGLGGKDAGPQSGVRSTNVAASRPFQCDPPTRALTWRDFLPKGG